MLQVVTLADGGRVLAAAVYLVVTLAACLAAVVLGASATGHRVPEEGQET